MRILHFAVFTITGSVEYFSPMAYSRVLSIDRPILSKFMVNNAERKEISVEEEEGNMKAKLGLLSLNKKQDPTPKPDNVEKVRPPDIGTYPDEMDEKLQNVAKRRIMKVSGANFFMFCGLLIMLSVVVIVFLCYAGPYPKESPIPVARDDEESQLGLPASILGASVKEPGERESLLNESPEETLSVRTRWTSVTLEPRDSNVQNEDQWNKGWVVVVVVVAKTNIISGTRERIIRG